MAFVSLSFPSLFLEVSIIIPIFATSNQFTLKHMDILECMPWMAQNAVFQRLSEIADVASLNKEERMKYDANMKAFRDTIAVMEGQYLEGRAEGIEENKRENARKMKEDGMPIELIAKYTGLSATEIESL